MMKYTAVFKNGEVVRTSEQLNSRVEFMNWICENRLGKIYGKLIEIRCTVMMKQKKQNITLESVDKQNNVWYYIITRNKETKQ